MTTPKKKSARAIRRDACMRIARRYAERAFHNPPPTVEQFANWLSYMIESGWEAAERRARAAARRGGSGR